MYTKRITLFFGDCYALVEMENVDCDCVLLTVSEMGKDEEKSTVDNEHLKTVRTTEICIGVDEVKEIIRSFQSLFPEK